MPGREIGGSHVGGIIVSAKVLAFVMNNLKSTKHPRNIFEFGLLRLKALKYFFFIKKLLHSYSIQQWTEFH